jgi:hypothetical protein
MSQAVAKYAPITGYTTNNRRAMADRRLHAGGF